MQVYRPQRWLPPASSNSYHVLLDCRMGAYSIRAICIAHVACWLCVGSAPSHADRAAPLVVFEGSPSPGPVERSANATLRSIAQAQGAGFVDLSPKPAALPRAQLLLRRAVGSYVDGRFADTAALLNELMTELVHTGAAGLSTGDLVDTFIYAGLAAARQHAGAAAWEHWVQAATIDATRRLDAGRHGPSALENYARAVEAVQAAKLSRVTVQSASECRVFFDGRQVPPAATITARYGAHYWRVACPGGQRFGARVVVQSPQQTLAPVFATVRSLTALDAANMGHRRGVGSVLFSQVVSSDGVATLTLTLLDTNTRRVHGQLVTVLQRGRLALLAKSVRAMIEGYVSVDRPATRSRGRPWYLHPVAWGVAGAIVASAVLVPLLRGGSEAPSRYVLAPEGLWR